MAVFERNARVAASLEEVWTFHLNPESLVTVSPEWLHLRVDRVAHRRGDTADDELTEGTELELSIRPFDVGPRTSWTSRVIECEFGTDRAYFVDRMVEGPLPTWEHQHQFVASDGGTRMVDLVRYELPMGPLRGLSAIARPALAVVFAHRHSRTRRELERESPRR